MVWLTGQVAVVVGGDVAALDVGYSCMPAASIETCLPPSSKWPVSGHQQIPPSSDDLIREGLASLTILPSSA